MILEKFIHQAVIVTGTVETVLNLHDQIKRLLWNAGTDYVRLLSPVSNGLANRIASFFIAPDGWSDTSEGKKLIRLLREDIKTVIKESGCQFAEIVFGLDR